jgi:hypothetical protein
MDEVLHEAWAKNTGGVAMAQEEIRLGETERQLLLRVLQTVMLATPGGVMRTDIDALIRKFSGVDKVVVVKTLTH